MTAFTYTAAHTALLRTNGWI